ncbi:hypothetical protein P3T23_003642 [Paraburkholderia sp. GAS448]
MLVDRTSRQIRLARSVTNISSRCQVLPGLRRAADSGPTTCALRSSWNATLAVGFTLARSNHLIDASMTYIPMSTPLTPDALDATGMHGVTKLHIRTHPLIRHLKFVYTSKDGRWLRSSGGWLDRRWTNGTSHIDRAVRRETRAVLLTDCAGRTWVACMRGGLILHVDTRGAAAVSGFVCCTRLPKSASTFARLGGCNRGRGASVPGDSAVWYDDSAICFRLSVDFVV